MDNRSDTVGECSKEDTTFLRDLCSYLSASISGMATAILIEFISSNLSSKPMNIGITAVTSIFIMTLINAACVLPFWIIVIAIGHCVQKFKLLYYAACATLIGLLIAPPGVAVIPPMMLDSDPIFLYADRLTYQFETQSLKFAVMGLVAGSTYWLVAIDWRQQRKRQPH